MDFVLDSSDSDATHHSLQRLRRREATTTTIGRAELMAAYAKLDTPKLARGPRSSDERMRLTNIMDSETNGEDTENLFLMPISVEELNKNTTNTNTTVNSNSNSQVKKPTIGSRSGTIAAAAPLELELSGLSDAEELLAEFATEDTSYLRFASRRSNALPASSPRTGDFGQLLQVDSASEPTTPKYKSIREELDQSKTRFRQSINELLNSSPISAVSWERAPRDFKEMVRMGSRLGEQVIGEIEEILEKDGGNSGSGANAVAAVTEGDRQLASGPTQHQRATKEELLQAAHPSSPTDANPFDVGSKGPKGIVNVNFAVGADAGAEPAASGVRLLVRRVWWALLMAATIFLADAVIQLAIARQQAGQPIVDFSAMQPLLERIDELFAELPRFLPAGLGGAVPH